MEFEKTAIENSKQIAALWESVKSAHKRLDDNDKITAGIHELAKNVALIASEIKSLTVKLDESVARIERGQTAQGERIGKIEKAMHTLERDEKTLEDHENRLDSIEKEPATAWKNLKWLIITGIASTVMGAVIGNLISVFGG